MVSSYPMSWEEAKMNYRERLEEAEHRELVRQVKANRPRVRNHFGSHIAEFVVALALALRLR